LAFKALLLILAKPQIGNYSYIKRLFIILWVFDWLQSIANGINGKFW